MEKLLEQAHYKPTVSLLPSIAVATLWNVGESKAMPALTDRNGFSKTLDGASYSQNQGF